jgi:hypothetical protein
MNWQNIRSIGGISCALLLACATQVHAETVDLTDGGVNPGLSDISVSFTGGNPSGSVTVGEFNWTVKDNNDAPNYVKNEVVNTFCIQGGQIATSGSFTVESLNSAPNPPLGGADHGVLDSTAAMQIQGFGNSFFSFVNAGTITYNATQYNEDEVAAAFQLGIWEIEYDGGSAGEAFPEAGNFNYFSKTNTFDTFNASAITGSQGAAAISLANLWLNNFTEANSVISLALVSNTDQDQMIFQPGGGTPPPPPAVPLPEALPAGLALLSGLGLVRFARRRMVR